ncbi:MAG: protein arginine kinase [Calditrichaeota bacterium]|nr:MAG: protein arginine kinase [Calditrichota bacterium]
MSVKEKKVKDAPRTLKSKLQDLKDWSWQHCTWLTREDDFSDVIISSRIRLARNIKGYCFPDRAEDQELEEIVHKVKEATKKCPSLKNALYVELSDLTEWDKRFIFERRLASPQFVEREQPALLVIDRDENLSIMVNEEDHLRMQSIAPGLGIREAWSRISNVDDELEEHLEYSFSDQFGYLTACPTNTGTGMRVSIFIHLPALAMLDEIKSVIKQLPISEIAVRGFYGEGTEPLGSIFQVSNQLTLGRTEMGIIERLEKIAQKLVELERQAREKLLKNDPLKVKDTVFRAVGTIKYAQIMDSIECLNLLSALRLGVDLKLIKNIKRITLNQLIVLSQPAHLQWLHKDTLSPRERDERRAEFVRKFLQL